jgi:hypothetical protein
MVREIITDWTTAAGGGFQTVLYFDDVGDVEAQRLAWDQFLTNIAEHMAGATEWTIRTDGRELDTGTGTLVGIWSEPTAHTGTGTGGTSSVADATQALMRWQTGQIVNGRFLQGRTFLPGFSTAGLSAGNLAPTVVADLNTWATNYIATGASHQVWSRPNDAGPGSAFQVTTGTGWSELAVLRRRRQ